MRYLAIAALIISTSAMACPEISGNFSGCKNSMGEALAGMEISQSVNAGITTYHSVSVDEETGEVLKEELIADGIARGATDTEGFQTINTVKCDGDKIIIDSKISNESAGISGTGQSLIFKSGNQLVTRIMGEINGNMFEDKIVCE